MLVLKVESETSLSEPSVDFGLVTRLAITVREFEGPNTRSIGLAQFALIHCAEALNRRVPISDVLDADSADLAELYPVLFEEESLKEAYQGGAGMDVIYVEELEMQREWQGRKIEEAIVRRVFDTWGASCAIGVMDLASLEALPRWAAMGFELVEDGEAEPGGTHFLVMDLGLAHPRVVEVETESTFQVIEGDGSDEDE